MEDLTGQLKNSRVLNIRMGTRQYSIDGHWGLVLICGIQVRCSFFLIYPVFMMLIVPSLLFPKAWNRITQSFKTQDKYKGRDIRTEDFAVCLAIFRSSFTNPTRLHPPSSDSKDIALTSAASSSSTTATRRLSRRTGVLSRIRRRELPSIIMLILSTDNLSGMFSLERIWEDERWRPGRLV